LKISVIRADELDSTAQTRWRQLQGSNPALASPYFSPGFTAAAAECCEDVRIAVVERSQQVVAFFPFQVTGSRGAPVGRMLSDHHGVVCAAGFRVDWPLLLRSSGLSWWRFDHLCGDQSAGLACRAETSLGLNLSRGFEAYWRGRQEAHPRFRVEYERKARKLARELGPLRFEPHVNDRFVFERVLQLKSEQYHRTGAVDVLAIGWTRHLLERVWQANLPDFGGRLSALYAGDTLVAAHLGMRSRRVWHWWFPVYDPAHAKYSPGIHLLLRAAEAAAAQGHACLDLGKGNEGYKQFLADESRPLAEGLVTRWESANAMLDAKQRISRWLRATTLARHLRPTVGQTRAQG
jgi:CelD/BcsL family acetyltransferase involved in cellulose biosynthesis